jgi:hypothetical protein
MTDTTATVTLGTCYQDWAGTGPMASLVYELHHEPISNAFHGVLDLLHERVAAEVEDGTPLEDVDVESIATTVLETTIEALGWAVVWSDEPDNPGWMLRTRGGDTYPVGPEGATVGDGGAYREAIAEAAPQVADQPADDAAYGYGEDG